MSVQKLIIMGCLAGASLFIGCNQATSPDSSTGEVDQQEASEPEMYEASELASLMRQMYEDNLEIGKEIEAGNIPKSFPEDFRNIHSAVATPGMKHDTAFFNAMAEQYIHNMELITRAETKQEAKIAYNEMILTCASCHQVYCQGPLAKIRRMKLSLDETTSGEN